MNLQPSVAAFIPRNYLIQSHSEETMAVSATLERTIAATESKVLSRAIARIARSWKLTDQKLGQILGISQASAHRLKAGGFELERGSKPFELGQYLLRLFRSLDAMTGSDDESSISWLKTHNLDLNGRPLDLIGTIRGLAEVADYVDDYRAEV
jgi:hypothetical protein